jgi:hypothetical protein
MTTKTAEQAREYIGRGWTVVPVPRGEKGPQTPEWQKLRINTEQVGEFFTEDSNIGVLLGEPSGGLADVDLDGEEALAIGPGLLPKTLTSGRGNEVTHFWYASPGIKSYKFKDIDGSVIVEIRADGGHQTLVSPRIHPSGDEYHWINPDTEPLDIDAQTLRSAAARVAVSALIAKHLPDGGRHDLALAYAGLMLKPLMELGEDKDDAVEYVHQVLEPAWEYRSAPNNALRDLYNAIEDTAEQIEADDKGLARLGGPYTRAT